MHNLTSDRLEQRSNTFLISLVKECKQLLHKDLAARNILVMREDLVKISDFGLSRLQDYYKIQESSKVPLKWYLSMLLFFFAKNILRCDGLMVSATHL